MRKGFLECDAEMRKMDAIQRGDDHSGSTAITAFVTPTHIVTGNCGDSRAILVASNGVKPLSFDHKPYNVRARPLPPAAAAASHASLSCRRRRARPSASQRQAAPSPCAA